MQIDQNTKLCNETRFLAHSGYLPLLRPPILKDESIFKEDHEKRSSDEICVILPVFKKNIFKLFLVRHA